MLQRTHSHSPDQNAPPVTNWIRRKLGMRLAAAQPATPPGAIDALDILAAMSVIVSCLCAMWIIVTLIL